MRSISKEEFTDLITNEVIAVWVEDGTYTAIAWIEDWDDCPFDTDRNRIITFAGDWELDKDLVTSGGFIHATAEKAGVTLGCEYFRHEEDREEGQNVYEDFFEYVTDEGENLRQWVSRKNPNLAKKSDIPIIQVDACETADVYANLADGMYIFIEDFV